MNNKKPLVCSKCGNFKRSHTYIVFHDLGFQLGEPGIYYCATCDPTPNPPKVQALPEPEEGFGCITAAHVAASLREQEVWVETLLRGVQEMLKYACPRCDLSLRAAADVYGLQITIAGVLDANEEKEPS